MLTKIISLAGVVARVFLWWQLSLCFYHHGGVRLVVGFLGCGCCIGDGHDEHEWHEYCVYGYAYFR